MLLLLLLLLWLLVVGCWLLAFVVVVVGGGGGGGGGVVVAVVVVVVASSIPTKDGRCFWAFSSIVSGGGITFVHGWSRNGLFGGQETSNGNSFGG